MRSSLASAVAAALICACGPEVNRAELDEVCGEASPFRLLDLDAGERLLSGRRIGERFWFVIGEEDDARVVSMGECGEDPVDVARDVYSPFEHERWPGRVLACTERFGGAMVVLDPDGVVAPRVVMDAPSCRGTPTDHGVVGVIDRGDGTNTLALVPYPADLDGSASAAIVLAEPTRGEPFYPEYAVRGDDVFAVDVNEDLVRITLPAGDSAVEQPSVGTWGVSTDATVLAWRDYDPAVEPPDFTIGTVQLRNRVDGRSVRFDDVSFVSAPPVSDDRRLGLRAGTEDDFVTHLVDLATFEARELPGDRRVVLEMPDGRLLMSAGVVGRLSIFDPSTGDFTPLADVVGGTMADGDPHSVIQVSGYDADERSIWRVPLDGSDAIALAHRAWGNYWFELDGRIVTPIEVDEDDIGKLVEIDPDSLHELAIDDRVQATSTRHGDVSTFHERDVVYAVDDGARSGIWVARLGTLD